MWVLVVVTHPISYDVLVRKVVLYPLVDLEGKTNPLMYPIMDCWIFLFAFQASYKASLPVRFIGGQV
jgi:hypothetical protein